MYKPQLFCIIQYLPDTEKQHKVAKAKRILNILFYAQFTQIILNYVKKIQEDAVEHTGYSCMVYKIDFDRI